jgi:hypothetical protein
MRRGALATLGAALLVLACGSGENPSPPAPLSIRGGVVIEPPELTIGQTATVEIAVVTPPDHRLEPPAAPEAAAGLWILAAEQLPTEREAGRWVHRARFLVRARATGETAWPAQTLFVVPPQGERIPVSLAERPLRVVEVSREFPERVEPFSWRGPRDPGRSGGFLLPAAFGAAAVLATLALVAVVRRARSAGRAAETAALEAPEGEAAPARAAQAALEAAAARVDDDAVAAADAASAALRRFVLERSGAPAHVSTTEEILAMAPPFLLARRWPELLQLLARLDSARFRAGALAASAGREALRGELRAAVALVDDVSPRRAP